MIVCQDNFLSADAFQELNTRILNRFDASLKEHLIKSGKKFFPRQAIMSRIEPVEDEDYTRTHILLGTPAITAVKSVQQYMINELQIKNPKPRSIWFQYTNSKHRVAKHLDDPVRSSSSEKSFTSLLYAHAHWEDTWGGELVIEDQSYLPKPNRLVVYSREHLHGVEPILNENNDYYRMFLGTSWSSDE